MLPRGERFHVDNYFDQGESNYTAAHPFTCQVLSDRNPSQSENTLVTIPTPTIPVTKDIASIWACALVTESTSGLCG